MVSVTHLSSARQYWDLNWSTVFPVKTSMCRSSPSSIPSNFCRFHKNVLVTIIGDNNFVDTNYFETKLISFWTLFSIFWAKLKAIRIFQFPKILFELFQVVSQIVNFVSIASHHLNKQIVFQLLKQIRKWKIKNLHHKCTCSDGHQIVLYDKCRRLFSFDGYLYFSSVLIL